MDTSSVRLRSLPPELYSELRMACADHGYRSERGQADGWAFFGSTNAPGEIALATAGFEGPYFASFDHSRVVRQLPNDDPDATPSEDCAKGHAGCFAFANRDALRAGLSRAYQLAVSLPTYPLEQFEAKVRELGATETEYLVRQRVGQDIFRDALMKFWRERCPLTGITDPALLRASHIVPWSKCETDDQRLDAYNGLLLSAHWDAAFDRGLVSFDPEGAVIVSPRLTEAARAALAIDTVPRLPLELEIEANMAWHRVHIFEAD